MYDKEEDTRERSRSPPSRREAEAEHKQINRMQHGVNPNSEEGRAERQKKKKRNDTRDGRNKEPKVLKYLNHHPHH
jgi:hypothetical protein